MASFNNFYKVTSFMITFTLLLKTSVSSGIISPSSEGPSNEIGYAPRPLTSYEKYLTNCVSKLKPKCGQEIFSIIFIGNQEISDYCCLSLTNDMGKSCHMDVTNHAVKLPIYKKNSTQILNRCVNVWNDCSLVSSPSPNPDSM